MKNFFKTKVPFLIICLLFVLFNVLFFTIAKVSQANASFWIGYGSIVLAFVLIGCIAYFYQLRSRNALTTIWSMMYAALGYFAVALIANLIFMFVNSPKVTAAIVVNFTILTFFAITCLIVWKSISRVEDNTARREQRVFTLRQISVKVNSLSFLAEDEEVKQAIKKLKENVDYSSSATNDSAKDYENQFTEQIDTIDLMIRQKAEKEEILKEVQTAENLLKLRNQMLMIK